MPHSRLIPVTCSRCHEEFILRIAAGSVRELRDKLQSYSCPHCQRRLTADKVEEIQCAAA